jgi:D-alanine-D-alanine ligase-like ATP-grasp enzyme
LDRHQIPNAPFAVISMSDGAADLSGFDSASLPYPLFIKPTTEGSSKGIDDCNKVNEPADLEPALKELGSKFPGQDILVESFLSGREFTVSVLGTGSQGRVIGIREHIWQTTPTKNGRSSGSPPDFASRLSKSSQDGEMFEYNDVHDMSEPWIEAACQVALDTWKVFNCRDCGRVDLRFDSDEPGCIPNVLEVSFLSKLIGLNRK